MSYMFKNCESLQNNLDLSSFDYNSVINKSNMLSGFNNLIKEDKYEILSSEYKKVDLSFKIIIISNSGEGYLRLINFCENNIFKNTYISKGYEYHDFIIGHKDKIIKLQIWDSNGQEMYRSPLTYFYPNASLAIIVYSINDKKSFYDIDLLLKDCKSCSPDMKFFIVGNKIDIDEKE